jgi:hypothetical protein
MDWDDRVEQDRNQDQQDGPRLDCWALEEASYRN